MNEAPISVIMPVFNMEAYVREAIESILNQTFSDFEFIIVDDASTDGSCGIISSYLSDSRVSLVSMLEQLGNHQARNVGIRQAKGRYICAMDADDIARPDRLKVQYQYMECHPEVLAAGTHYSFIGMSGDPVKPQSYDDIREALLVNNCFLHPSLIIRSAALRVVGGYDGTFVYSADYDLMCRLALIGPVVNLPENLMTYRWHTQQISSSHHLEQQQFAHKARRKYQMAMINQLLEKTDLKPVTIHEVDYSEVGQAIYYFAFAKVHNRMDYEAKGELLLEAAYTNIGKSSVISLEEKLLSIRYGIVYLLNNGLAEGDEAELLNEIDNCLTGL